MIDLDSDTWTDAEIQEAVAVLEKVRRVQEKGKGMPRPVFEAFVRSKKNISTEIVLFGHGRESIYLIQRPENDPYAGQWHAPGVTHALGTTMASSLETFGQREQVSFRDIQSIGQCEVPATERGPYLLMVHTAVAVAEQENPKGRFFPLRDIPWDDLVSSHRDEIIPLALRECGLEEYLPS